MVFSTEYTSPLGVLTLAEENSSLIGLWLPGQKYFPKEHTWQSEMTPALLEATRWLDRYFSGQRPDPGSLSLELRGSDFRREVWELLRQIPYGETTTYGAIAQELARRRGIAHMSAQAVGSAVGHNPVSIILPCHRVVGSDGSLTGYAGGVEKKQWLLNFEKH